MLCLHRATRPLSPTRLLMLALLVLGMLAKPVLAAAGEAHEFKHDPSGLHLHLGDHADEGRSSPSTPDAAPEDDNGDLLHTLLHFAHCCGQSPQGGPGTMMTVPAVDSGARSPALASAPAPTHASHGVFRPPISG